MRDFSYFDDTVAGIIAAALADTTIGETVKMGQRAPNPHERFS